MQSPVTRNAGDVVAFPNKNFSQFKKFEKHLGKYGAKDIPHFCSHYLNFLIVFSVLKFKGEKGQFLLEVCKSL